jgi:sugar/nucleoside kinase (ribokinase family)
VFGNVEELKSLYETDDFATAVQGIARDAELAAVTMGAEGAMVVHHGEVMTVPAYAIDHVVDATGAGDLFASGFLLALARGQDFQTALRLGCLSASEVISHYGARPVEDLAALAREKGLVGEAVA